MSKHLSGLCEVNIIDGGNLQLSKRKTRKSVTPGQNPYYYYNVILRVNVWKKIFENRKKIETTALQVLDQRLSAPQIIPLTDNWVVYLSVFKEILYYGIHMYEFSSRKIIPGNGMNLSGDEVTKFFDFLEENAGNGGQQLVISIPQYSWEWLNINGEIRDTELWWTSEVLCLQAALLKQPGDGWKINVKSNLKQQQFNTDFLDNILLHLTSQRIKSLSNAAIYYNTQPDIDLSPEEIESYALDAFNSITKMDILELTLETVKKNQYISLEATIYMMTKISEYLKNPQIISQLKTGINKHNLIQ